MSYDSAKLLLIFIYANYFEQFFEKKCLENI